MSTTINIFVQDVVGLTDASYDFIKVYRSMRPATDYSEVTAVSTRIALSPLVSRYSYYDVFGNPDSWYKWSYFSSTLSAETALSDSVRGTTVSGTGFRGATYPSETDLNPAQQEAVLRIRGYIGDVKEVVRDYISSTTSYDNVSDDRKTITLDNPKGWPLSVVVDGVSYETILDPVVNGYQFLTFSGTEISTTSGTADIWYHHFRYSDKEIIDAYDRSELPAGVALAMATPEMAELQTSINLLEGELRNFMATSSSRVDIYQEISIDPAGGLRARQLDLENLRARVANLVKIATANNLTLYGVRID